jgi:lysophospholipase L1-like esterase
LPEVGGYDYWLRQRLYAGRSPVEYEPGLTFSVPSKLEFYRCNDRRCASGHSESEIRIVCLGGSTTWGDGVSDEETYPAQLENTLNRNHRGFVYSVINLGLPGTTSYWGAKKSMFVADRLGPRVAILGYGGLNDSLKVHFRDSTYGYFSSPHLFLRSFYVYRLVEHTYYRYGLYPSAMSRVTPAEYRENCLEIYGHFRGEGVPVAFLGEWSPRYREDEYGISSIDFERLRTEQRALAEELGIPLIDPQDCFRGRIEESFLSDMAHWSATGCRRIAECCADEILKVLQAQ